MSTNVIVRDLPPETVAVWRQRAAAAGKSLQQYMRAMLIDQAAAPTIEEALSGIRRRVHAGGYPNSVDDATIAAAIADSRP